MDLYLVVNKVSVREDEEPLPTAAQRAGSRAIACADGVLIHIDYSGLAGAGDATGRRRDDADMPGVAL